MMNIQSNSVLGMGAPTLPYTHQPGHGQVPLLIFTWTHGAAQPLIRGHGVIDTIPYGIVNQSVIDNLLYQLAVESGSTYGSITMTGWAVSYSTPYTSHVLIYGTSSNDQEAEPGKED